MRRTLTAFFSLNLIRITTVTMHARAGLIRLRGVHLLCVTLFFSPLVMQGCSNANVPEGERTSVVGTVQDKNTKPIPGVEVIVVNSETGFSTTTKTKVDGSFEISGLPPGRYKVVAAIPGVPLMTKEIALTTGKVALVVLGGPIPEGERNEIERTAEVIKSTFQDEVKLQMWINAQAEKGKRLRAIIPVEYQTSLFLIESSGTGAVTPDLVQRVNRPLLGEEVLAHLNLHKDKTFVGLHRLDSNSYLMVFRYGRG